MNLSELRVISYPGIQNPGSRIVATEEASMSMSMSMSMCGDAVGLLHNSDCPEIGGEVAVC
jgi:hypothetical protein